MLKDRSILMIRKELEASGYTDDLIEQLSISLDFCSDSDLEIWHKYYKVNISKYLDYKDDLDIYSKYKRRISVRDNFYSYIRNSNSERVLCIIRDFRDRMSNYLNGKIFDPISNVEMDRMHSDVNRMMSILFVDAKDPNYDTDWIPAACIDRKGAQLTIADHKNIWKIYDVRTEISDIYRKYTRCIEDANLKAQLSNSK